MDGKNLAFKIRALMWGDMNDVVENYYSFFDELKDDPELGLAVDGEKPSASSEAKWFAELYSELLERSAVVCVASVAGKVVGMCSVRRRDHRPVGSHVGVLGIAVRKSYRDRGIGEQMLRWCLKRSVGVFDMILLSVFSSNQRAKRLYERVGFMECGRLPNGFKRNNIYIDEIMMVFDMSRLEVL